MKPDDTVFDIMSIKNRMGFSGIPVTDTGELDGKLLGLCTLRDIDFIPEEKWSLTPLREVLIGI